MSRAVNEFLHRDLLLQVDMDLQRGDGFTPDPDLTVKEALDRAAARIKDRFSDQPLVEAAIRLTIGRAYRSVGEDRLALAHLERAVQLRTAHLGFDHPDTVTALLSKAMAHQTDRPAETIALLEQILEKRTAALGENHQATLFAFNSLGEVCRTAGHLERAADLIQQALERKKTALGMDHPFTVHSIHDLGLVYRDMGRYPEAIELLEQAVQIYRSRVEVDRSLHSMVLASAGSLADAYQKAGRLEDAARVRRDVGIPHDDPVALTEQRVRLAEVLLTRKQYADAESVLRDCLAASADRRTQTWFTFDAKSLLAVILLEQKKYAEAEPLLLGAYKGMADRQSKIPARVQRLTATVQLLAQLYRETNKPDQATKWRKELEKRAESGESSAESRKKAESGGSRAESQKPQAARKEEAKKEDVKKEDAKKH